MRHALGIARARPHLERMTIHFAASRIMAVPMFLGMMMGTALATCPALPDGPASFNITNGQQRALCLQDQLHDTIGKQRLQTRIIDLQVTLEQQQIQQRFDRLPTFAAPSPWQR